MNDRDVRSVLWIHVPDAGARPLTLPEGPGPFAIGRDAGCEVVIEHASVSRRHALLARDGAGWRIADAGSKNGVRVAGNPVAESAIATGQWFSVGDVFATLESVPERRWRDHEDGIARRRASTQRATGRIAAASSGDELFATLLQSFVEVADCRRGFVLAGDPRHGFLVRACRGVDPLAVDERGFDGSAAVIERALSQRRCLLAGDALSQPWMRARASIVGRGIRAVACMPLLHEGAIVGALYADTDDGARRFEALDAELLEALGSQASLVMAALRLTERLDRADRTLVLGADGGVVQTTPPRRWSGETAV